MANRGGAVVMVGTAMVTGRGGGKKHRRKMQRGRGDMEGWRCTG